MAISNSTGFRFAVLLSKPPKLPKRVELAQAERGVLQIGVNPRGRVIRVTWDEIGHLLVAGMTRSGKSSFLRSVAYQAIADGAKLLLGDLPLTTFSALDGHPALLLPVAEQVQAYPGLVQRALDLCEERKALFRAAEGYPEKLSEYNAWAVRSGQDPQPRVLVVLDEYNAAAKTLGKAFERQVATLAYTGLKFGVHLVVAAQAFDKQTLGNVRDQFGAVVAFRVKSAVAARNVGVRDAERIPASRPGLAATDRWGLVQTSYLPKERLIAPGSVVHTISLNNQERRLMELAWEQEQGRVSIPKLMA